MQKPGKAGSGNSRTKPRGREGNEEPPTAVVRSVKPKAVLLQVRL